MPLMLNDEQRMLRETSRGFIEQAAPVAHLRALRDGDDPIGFDRALWAKFGEMGFAGILVPEAHGGSGLGMVEAGIVAEEIGRTLAPSPFLTTAIGGASLFAAGSQAQRARWLPGIAAGETVVALAIDEGPRHRPADIAMTAERQGNGFRLTGRKSFVQHAHAADVIVVAARIAGVPGETDGITLFEIDPSAPGLSIAPERLLDASISSALEFDGVSVDADAVIGEVGAGWAPFADMARRMRTGVAAELLGVGQAATARTLGYLTERTQFGVPIGSFQALQHRAAILYAELQVASAATLKAAQLIDAGDPDAERRSRVAKAMAGLSARLAVQEGVQMHGGIGMTDEHDIGLYMKHHPVLDRMFGDADGQVDALAAMAGY